MARPISLFDVEALAPVAEVAASLGLRVEIFGSVASRAAMAFLHQRDDQTLFDLVPNTSDVDLVHNGPAYLNAPLRAAINEVVPYAQWVRWSVQAYEEAAPAFAARAFNNDVPLRRLAIGMRPRFLPETFVEAVNSERPRYVANSAYRDSPLFRQGRDLELFSLVIYFSALADLACWRQEVYPDFETISPVARRFLDTDRDRLGDEHLQARLWYLLSSWAGRVSWSAAQSVLADLRLLDTLPRDVVRPFEAAASVTSSRLARDYRLPRETALDRGAMAGLRILAGLKSRDGSPAELDPVFSPFATTELMPLRNGPAPSVPETADVSPTLARARWVDVTSTPAQAGPRDAPRRLEEGVADFATLSWETKTGDPAAADLTGFLFMKTPGSEQVRSIHTNTVAGRHGAHGRTWFRFDLAPALRAASSAEDAIMVAVVQPNTKFAAGKGG